MAFDLNINDEIGRLNSVVLGVANSNGPTPDLKDAYDPKSAEHIKAGTYPTEQDMVEEIETFAQVLKRHGVQVFRPELIENYNQIFARDIAFVIEDKMIIANILDDRSKEIEALDFLMAQIDPKKIIHFSEHAHIEGGDVMPWGDYIFVGTFKDKDYRKFITARTNMAAVEHLQELFPHKKVVSFSLKKSNFDPRENALHLDCCFQPVGKGKAIIHKEGFLIEQEYQWLVDFIGPENLFLVDKEEMYHMNCNVFSISPEVIVSEQGFTRLNNWLRAQGFTVEEIPYSEIAKQEGLLRCSTMPLSRERAIL
jgi:N-dimethylarginine dimethylaminohydrolase